MNLKKETISKLGRLMVVVSLIVLGVSFSPLTGQADTDLEAFSPGNVGVSAIGGFVWNDINANGIQDIGEAGLNSITVNLYDNNIFQTNLQSGINGYGDGTYLFLIIITDTSHYFKVGFVLPPGYVFSPQYMGGDPVKDSDADPNTGFGIPNISGTPLPFSYPFNFLIDAGMHTNPVPEPSTMLLLGSGLIGLVGYGRKKFLKK